MPADNNRNKRHKHHRSSGDLTKDQIDELTIMLTVIEGQVQTLQNKQWGDIEEVEHLVKETRTVIAQVRQFQALKERNAKALVRLELIFIEFY